MFFFSSTFHTCHQYPSNLKRGRHTQTRKTLLQSPPTPSTFSVQKMEAVSSTRLGRASSRYGAPTVFSGPVRKWKKKWVHVPSPTTPSSTSHNSHCHSNTNTNSSSRLLLRRWTPITATAAAADDDPHNSPCTPSDEPPRRKFRYTPVCVFYDFVLFLLFFLFLVFIYKKMFNWVFIFL